MFDLERSITAWRKQMLAAGIQSPVPLEELESHLSEEIERQMRSGLSEEDAASTAILKFGKASVIQAEFKKTGIGGRILRPLMLIFGWLTANCMLIYCVVDLEFNWNFFNFATRWNQRAIIVILGIAAATAALWFLIKASRGRTSRAVMLAVAVLMSGFIVETFPPEKVPDPAPLVINPGEDPTHAMVGTAIHRALQRHEPSPLWFRGGQSLLLCLPVIFWISQARRPRGEPTPG